MKVLFVCSGNNPEFNLSPFIKSQAESLRNIGTEVDIYTINRSGLMGYLSHIKPLRRKIQSGNYDLIHAHYTFSGWVARLATQKKPLVVSYMGTDFAGVFKPDGKRKAISLLMIFQGMLLNFFAGKVIVKSKQQLRMLPRKSKAVVIPNGVNFEAFRPLDADQARTELNLRKEIKYILFLGDPADPRKNFPLAKSAFELVNKELEVELLVPFPVSPEKVSVYLNAANVLIFTSYFEGSSNLLKEAMACNCPVVTTPAGDAKEILNGVSQCFVTGYNPAEMAAKVIAILNAGKRSNGRERSGHLRDSIIAEKIMRVYRKALRIPEPVNQKLLPLV